MDAALRLDGASLAVTRVLDVSAGGALFEVAADAVLPALGARASVVLTRGDHRAERSAHVVRVRWGGRERGAPLPPAVALVFDDGDAEAATRLERLLDRRTSA